MSTVTVVKNNRLNPVLSFLGKKLYRPVDFLNTKTVAGNNRLTSSEKLIRTALGTPGRVIGTLSGAGAFITGIKKLYDTLRGNVETSLLDIVKNWSPTILLTLLSGSTLASSKYAEGISELTPSVRTKDRGFVLGVMKHFYNALKIKRNTDLIPSTGFSSERAEFDSYKNFTESLTNARNMNGEFKESFIKTMFDYGYKIDFNKATNDITFTSVHKNENCHFSNVILDESTGSVYGIKLVTKIDHLVELPDNKQSHEKNFNLYIISKQANEPDSAFNEVTPAIKLSSLDIYRLINHLGGNPNEDFPNNDVSEGDKTPDLEEDDVLNNILPFATGTAS